ncbi:MAG: hypothetical protein ACI8RD_011839 [Bacillariaceae sp.]|jgi:hypothetical protein
MGEKKDETRTLVFYFKMSHSELVNKSTKERKKCKSRRIIISAIKNNYQTFLLRCCDTKL